MNAKSIESTRQGVRNLNGPLLNGTKYNGRKVSCPHWRAPDLIPTFMQPTTELVDGIATTKYSTFCTGCGVKLFDNGER